MEKLCYNFSIVVRIMKLEDTFRISVHNPFLEEMNIKKSIYIIAFSPLYNGYFTRNTKTNLTLQDDMAVIYQKLLYERGRRCHCFSRGNGSNRK